MTRLLSKFRAGLRKTHSKLAHEIKRIVTRSARLDAAALEELEAALIAADLGMGMTTQIMTAVKRAYETQGRDGLDVFAIAAREIQGFCDSKGWRFCFIGGIAVQAQFRHQAFAQQVLDRLRRPGPLHPDTRRPLRVAARHVSGIDRAGGHHP